MQEIRAHEAPFTPEAVSGMSFRVPSLRLIGLGQRYELTGLHLPRGWQAALPQLQALDRDRLQRNFEQTCHNVYDNDREYADPDTGLKFDHATGLLTEVSVARPGLTSRLVLDERLTGGYVSENIRDIHAAVALSSFFASEYLSVAGKAVGIEGQYGYIQTNGSRSGARNLRLPDFVSEGTVGLTREEQNQFSVVAENIADSFGQPLYDLYFTNNGILNYVHTSGDSTYAIPNYEKNKYIQHNVHDLYQASALHAVVAAFLNGLIAKHETMPSLQRPNRLQGLLHRKKNA